MITYLKCFILSHYVHCNVTHLICTQTSLQSVIGTTAAASFTDDLHRWQKQLQTIEAVLGVWLQVQALWSQLEVTTDTRSVYYVHTD